MKEENKLMVECLNCGNTKEVVNKPILMPEETHIIFSNYCPDCDEDYWIEHYISKDGDILNSRLANFKNIENDVKK